MIRAQHHIQVTQAEDGRFDAIGGFELVAMGLAEGDEGARRLREQQELLGRLATARDGRWIELQYIGLPDSREPWRSRVRVVLFLGVRERDASGAAARCGAVLRSATEAVSCGGSLYELEPVCSEQKFKELWHAIEVNNTTELARHVWWDRFSGRCRVSRLTGKGIEFGSVPRALLAAGNKARVRVIVRPTRLLPWEEIRLLHLAGRGIDGQGKDRELGAPDESPAHEGEGVMQGILGSRERLLLMRIWVESESVMPSGVTAAIARDVAGVVEPEAGQGVHDLEVLPLERVRELPLTSHRIGGVPTVLPDGLERVRHLFTLPEAARAFRLPILAEALHGLPGQSGRFLCAPATVPGEGLRLGRNGRSGDARPIAITPDSRLRHMYVIGQTGTGKSWFLSNLIMQDIEAGHGVCVLDPHGDLIERVCGLMPARRVHDVVLLDPADLDCPVGFNPLDCRDSEERELVCEEFVALFSHLWPVEFCGPMFQYHIRNLMLLMMHLASEGRVPSPPSLLGLPRYTTDMAFLGRVREWIRNPILAAFVAEWTKGSGSWKSEMSAWLLCKFDVLLNRSAIRHVIGQRSARLKLRSAIEERKVLLVRLPTGQLGEITAKFIGKLVMAKIQAVMMGRVDRHQSERVPFHVYCDEVQNFVFGGLPVLLAEGRKFGISLVMANQYLAQLKDWKLHEMLLGGIFGNVGTMVAFRTSHEDGAELAKQFGGAVKAADLVTLRNHQAYARVLGSDGKPHVTSLWTEAWKKEPRAGTAERCRAGSRERYGQKVETVMAGIVEEAAALAAISEGKQETKAVATTAEAPESVLKAGLAMAAPPRATSGGAVKAKVQELPSGRAAEARLSARYTMSRFIVGKSNVEAHGMAQWVARHTGGGHLYLYGGSGVGKTHLLQAIGHELLERDANATVLYVTGETFNKEFDECAKKNRYRDQFRARYRDVAWLLLDDLHLVDSTERSQDELLHTLRYRALQRRVARTVVSGTGRPQELSNLATRVGQHLSGYHVVELGPLEKEVCIAILGAEAIRKAAMVQHDVLRHIVDRGGESIFDLLNVLLETISAARVANVRPAIEVVESVLKRRAELINCHDNDEESEGDGQQAAAVGAGNGARPVM